MSSLVRQRSKCICAVLMKAAQNVSERESLSLLRKQTAFLYFSNYRCRFRGAPVEITQSRQFHCSLGLSQREKRSKNLQPLDTSTTAQDDPSIKDPEKMEGKLVFTQKPSGCDRQVTPHSEITKKPQEEVESYLPTHDVQRITNESRRLERRAVSIFDEAARVKGLNKEGFRFALQRYTDKESLYRRGSLEMIYAGLGKMKEFGVIKDLESYKVLLEIFPEGKMIPRNAWQVEFMHYPRQQQCCIDLLEQMEVHGVVPDENFGIVLKNRFGNEAHAARKYRRMMYWMPKFKNINPYPIPYHLPENPEELALMALKRMCVDKETQYTVWKTEEEEPDCEEHTFVASAQSPMQRELIQRHEGVEPLFVEGPYPVYLRTARQLYFLLRAEPNVNDLMKKKQQEKEENDEDNLFEWKNFFEDEDACNELRPILSVHEQEDSTILALCITGTSSKASVFSWVKYLERENPQLTQIPVLFKLNTGLNELDVVGDNRSFREKQES